MKLNLSKLLLDLESFIPDTLTSIISFVRNHSDYNKITFMVRNSKISSTLFNNKVEQLLVTKDLASDIQLAGLIVIAEGSYNHNCNLLDSVLEYDYNWAYWAKAMIASYIINK
jgi:hypothetical protein